MNDWLVVDLEGPSPLWVGECHPRVDGPDGTTEQAEARWWCTSLTSALRKIKIGRSLWDFAASLVHIVSSRIARATYRESPVYTCMA